MPWGRLDDSLYDHPKVDALPPRLRNACVGLWVRAISWSNRYLTDGAVPTERLRKLDGSQAHIDALVATGMFDVTSDGVTVHDFLTFNDSADEVRRRRAQMRELGRLGGQATRSAQRSSDTLSDNAERPALTPVPSRPSPVPSLPNRTPLPPIGNGDGKTPPTGALAEVYRQHERAATVPIKSLADRGIKRP